MPELTRRRWALIAFVAVAVAAIAAYLATRPDDPTASPDAADDEDPAGSHPEAPEPVAPEPVRRTPTPRCPPNSGSTTCSHG